MDFIVKRFPPNETVPSAIGQAGMKQPGVILVNNHYYVIIDGVAIPAGDRLLRAVEKLVQVVYVFNVHYYEPAKYAFAFMERMMGISAKISTSSVRVDEMWRQVNVVAQVGET